MSEIKRLCIDINSVIPLYSRGYLTGVGRTTFDLVRALNKQKDNLPFEVILYSQNTKGVKANLLNLKFKYKHLYYPYREKWNEILSFFPVRECLIGYDLLHIPQNYIPLYSPSKAVITLHDALFMIMQEKVFEHELLKDKVPGLASKCKAIITCSESSKHDIIDTMNIQADKITVVPWGISKNIFFPEENNIIQDFNQKNSLHHPYFTMVSCSDGRKNTTSLLKAYKLYLSQGGNYDLVLLWNNPPEYIIREFSTEIEQKRLHFLSSINEDDLRALYSGATASFFPSKYEGFGLPILESMACGTPVVTCRNSSLEEVGADIALYTGSEDIEQMAQYMYDFENKRYDIQDLRARGLNHAEKFSWQKTANAYIDFYKKYI